MFKQILKLPKLFLIYVLLLLPALKKKAKPFIIISIIFYFFPLITGIFDGVSLAVWSVADVAATTQQFDCDHGDALRSRDPNWLKPLYSEIADVDSFFNVLRVKDMDWATKMKFRLPDECYDPDNMDMTLDNLANLNALVQPVDNGTLSEETWLYLSNSTGNARSNWDYAFKHAVDTASSHHNLKTSAFYVATCDNGARFLCNVWRTRSPALVHFVVEDEPVVPEDIPVGFTYSAPLERLQKVTARIIEFPLEGVYTGLTLSTFPSEEAQISSIMAGEGLYEQFEPYNAERQMWKRWEEYMDREIWDKEGTVTFYWNNVYGWLIDNVYEPLGLMIPVGLIHLWIMFIVERICQTVIDGLLAVVVAYRYRFEDTESVVEKEDDWNLQVIEIGKRVMSSLNDTRVRDSVNV